MERERKKIYKNEKKRKNTDNKKRKIIPTNHDQLKLNALIVN